MWMNVYIEANKCECCSRIDKLHLAKLSFWRDTTFRWHQYLDESWESILWRWNITTTKQWKEITKTFKIINEYWEYITYKDFREIVKEKRKDWRKHEIKMDRQKYDRYWNYIVFYEFC